jgi:hypothetical protein
MFYSRRPRSPHAEKGLKSTLPRAGVIVLKYDKSSDTVKLQSASLHKTSFLSLPPELRLLVYQLFMPYRQGVFEPLQHYSLAQTCCIIHQELNCEGAKVFIPPDFWVNIS